MEAGLQIDKASDNATPSPISTIIIVASIAAGVQFGWALQLSLLTPYVQLLGVPHMWSAFIWLCGPISGMIVQPTVGYYSDRCTSRFGRRRPFIVGGTVLVTIAVFLIGFAADIGRSAGDPTAADVVKPRAVAIFVVGFWILDVANNTLQGPCRALLADLSAGDQHCTRAANAAFAFFMAVGNVLGYAAGSYQHLYKLLHFSRTDACDAYCANLKTCFIISILLLISVTILASLVVDEKQPRASGCCEDDAAPRSEPFIGQIVTAFKTLSRSMSILMLVTCLNWIAWFPFLLYDTDWMGKEVYGGEVEGAKSALYNEGVRMGSLGLMLNSIALAATSVGVEPAVRMVGVKRVWGGVNFVLAACLALTVWVTKAAESGRSARGEGLPPPGGVNAGALTLFAVLGMPLAVTYSIPFALASIFSSSSGAGQGLSLGVLNIAIVVPQMFVSVVCGPLDAAFGGGNLAGFVMGAIAAAASGFLALTVLPSPPQEPLSLAPASH